MRFLVAAAVALLLATASNGQAAKANPTGKRKLSEAEAKLADNIRGVIANLVKGQSSAIRLIELSSCDAKTRASALTMARLGMTMLSRAGTDAASPDIASTLRTHVRLRITLDLYDAVSNDYEAALYLAPCDSLTSTIVHVTAQTLDAAAMNFGIAESTEVKALERGAAKKPDAPR